MYHIKTSNASGSQQLISLLLKPDQGVKLTTTVPSDVLVSHFMGFNESITGLQSACFSM